MSRAMARTYVPRPHSASNTDVSAVGHLDELEPVDLHGARLELHFLALAREVIGPLPVDLDGGEGGRRLQDLAEEARQQRFDRGARRRTHVASCDDLPSASSVSVSAPQATVKR
jgi:hypothetical protein